VIGIKTGYTEEAGGNLVFAARRQVSGQQVDIIGAILGQADRPAAFEATRRLITPLAQNLQVARVLAAGQPVATIDPEWSGEVQIVAAEDVHLLVWPGMTLQTDLEFGTLKAGMKAGTLVGWLTLRLGDQERRVPLHLAKDLPGAGVVWKLTRT
jgi:D-alanyl-D-alanine carboxypeptidase